MRCPFCGNDEDKVVDSRSREDGRVIRRRRLCMKCDQRFSTIEEIEDKALYVIKSDNRREDYDREKLMRGMKIACIKRPVSIEVLEEIAARIEIELKSDFIREIHSREIGEMVSKRLREIDEVAYVRFASVYRNFRDKDEFLKELNQMKTK